MRILNGLARLDIFEVRLVIFGRLRHAPRQFLELHAIVDDGTRPDVHETGIIDYNTRQKSEQRTRAQRHALLFSKSSGAMYGSLPHNPVDMWIVVSQGRRYTVDAPKSPIYERLVMSKCRSNL